MPRTPKDITDAELAVLQLLWANGPSSVRDLTDRLYPRGGASECATVQKLCERLAAKACVARDRRERPARYRAVLDREQLIGRQLRAVADKLCGGAYLPLLSHLVGGGALDPGEVAGLRQLVAKLDQRPRARRKNDGK